MKQPSYFRLSVFLIAAAGLCLAAFVPVGCLETFRTRGHASAESNDEESPTRQPVVESPDSEGPDGGVDSDLETDMPMYLSDVEEHEMEDPSALDALIATKLGTNRTHRDTAQSAALLKDAEDRGAVPRVVPEGAAIMKLSDAACLKQLKLHKVPYERPDFDTPLVETPVLLTGPIEGVSIAPMYPGKTPVHSVMDCRLALALVQTAHQLKAFHIAALEFYSTYRPLARPPQSCPSGKKGKRCRKATEQYEKIRAAQTSQHRFARAVDIRRFLTEDGETLDVLEDFDRKSGKAPCSYRPDERKARILSDIVCTLHAHRVFSVMLTPNADKAHHNHFHFDLTPRAGWYIVR